MHLSKTAVLVAISATLAFTAGVLVGRGGEAALPAPAADPPQGWVIEPLADMGAGANSAGALARMAAFDELAARVPVPDEAGREAELDKLRAEVRRLHRFKSLAMEASPADGMSVALGLTREEVDRWVMRSHFVDDAAELRTALLAVGADEFYAMMQEERDWLRLHAEKSEELDRWAFREWVDRESRAFCRRLTTRGLPFPLTENFRRIVAE